jgi:RHS repeat-associated protein
MTDSNGAQVGTTMKYYPFGAVISGSVNTDKKFTGQRLDSTGLYYYNARYYDAMIGRFISPDKVVQSATCPQCLNRYSYCFNNPLKYSDPSGNFTEKELNALGITMTNVSLETWTILSLAKYGDLVTIVKSDGTVNTYTFTQYPKGTIVLESNTTSRMYNPTGLLGDKANEILTLRGVETIDIGDGPYTYIANYSFNLKNKTQKVWVDDLPKPPSPKKQTPTNWSRVCQFLGGCLKTVGGAFLVGYGAFVFSTSWGTLPFVYGPCFYNGIGCASSGINDIAGNKIIFDDYPLLPY